MRGHSEGFGIVERLFREVLCLGQQTFDARNPGQRAGQCDLLQAWRGGWTHGLLADLACALKIAEPQAGAREKGGAVLSDLIVGKVLRSEMIDKRLFDLGGFSVLHGDESSREHESGLVGGVQLAGAVARPDDPRRGLAGRGTRGQREREVDEATGFAARRPPFLPWQQGDGARDRRLG